MGGEAQHDQVSTTEEGESSGQAQENDVGERSPAEAAWAEKPSKQGDTDSNNHGLPIEDPLEQPAAENSSDDGYESAIEPEASTEPTSTTCAPPAVESSKDSDLKDGEQVSQDLSNGIDQLSKVEKASPEVHDEAPSPRAQNDPVEDASEVDDVVSPVRTSRDEKRASGSKWPARSKKQSISEQMVLPEHLDAPIPLAGASEWSHQMVVPQKRDSKSEGQQEIEWQEMPAFASHDIYNDDGKLIARAARDDDDEAAAYAGRGGAGKGYTKVNVDDDAQSASSMDENTRYLFKEGGTLVVDEDEEARDPLAQLQATKDLLTEPQRIAYVAVVRVAIVTMLKDVESIEGTKATKKELRLTTESMKMWGQKMMVRLYAHMDVSAEGGGVPL